MYNLLKARLVLTREDLSSLFWSYSKDWSMRGTENPEIEVRYLVTPLKLETMRTAIILAFVLLASCAISYKINRHFSQGEQVYVQKHDGCCNIDVWGEIMEQPHEKDSSGVIIYRVKLPTGWIMPFKETVLDSLNNHF